MAILDTTTVSALLVLVALATLASVVTLGMVLRASLDNRPARAAVTFHPDVTAPATAVRRIAAAAALILGIQVIAACGNEKAEGDTAVPGAPVVKVQSFVGSADAVDRPAGAIGGSPVGSADAVERRAETVKASGACVVSADAAERLGHAPC